MAGTPIRPANEDRGELAVTLDGQAFVLRPSFEAIEAFEKATGKGLLELARAGLEGSLSLSETALVVTECVRAFGRETGDVNFSGARPQRIGELITECEGGFQSVLVTVAGMLALASTGGVTSAGEIKAATKTTTTSAPSAVA